MLTFANQIYSKQWKSLHEIDIFILLLAYVIVILFQISKELWFSRSIWLGPCKVLMNSHNLNVLFGRITSILSID